MIPSVRTGKFLLFIALAAIPAFGNITYTCDPSINTAQAGTCTYLNSTISGIYSSLFSNANANIYITMGSTGLGESNTALDTLSYSQFRTDLIADSSGDAVDTAAIASLPATEPALWSGDSVAFTSAIGSALGFTANELGGITAAGASCTLSSAGCYNGVITITNSTGLLYWRQNGGTIPSNEYDFYAVVEHETDEVLGTASCVSTTGASLVDGCTNPTTGADFISPADLFRYNAGSRVFISTTPGAYFSYNGGATNGANGAVYNTLANGEDYADYADDCEFVQDTEGCPGEIFNINTDGGAETNVLDAVGFNLNAQTTPEPATLGVLGMSLVTLILVRKRRTQ